MNGIIPMCCACSSTRLDYVECGRYSQWRCKRCHYVSYVDHELEMRKQERHMERYLEAVHGR